MTRVVTVDYQGFDYPDFRGLRDQYCLRKAVKLISQGMLSLYKQVVVRHVVGPTECNTINQARPSVL